MGEYTFSCGYDDRDHDEYSRIKFPTNQKLYGRNWEFVASDLADSFYHNNDGWESSWPLEIRMYEDGVEVGRASVDMEMVPTFYARSA